MRIGDVCYDLDHLDRTYHTDRTYHLDHTDHQDHLQ